MFRKLDTHDVARELYEDTYNGFSWDGCLALAEWLEQYEEDTGTEMELDVVAIRCDFSEYDSALEAAKDLGWEPEVGEDDDEEDDDREQEAFEWLEHKTTVISGSFGVIIQNV